MKSFDKDKLKRIIDAAAGRIPADIVIKNSNIPIELPIFLHYNDYTTISWN